MTTTVMLLFGGRSSEHAISCATAAGVLDAIDRDRYTVIPVGITRAGAWVLERDDADRFRLDPDNMPEIVANGTRVLLPEDATTREIRVVRDGRIDSLGDVDVVLPLLHGPFGEDGTVQGLLELVGVPFVGSKVLAASTGMDKHYTKVLLEAAGIEVAPGFTVTAQQWQEHPDTVRERAAALGETVFVKPARAGSSVGVSKVADPAQLDPAPLDPAMTEALAWDDHVLVEGAIVGREVEFAVLGGRRGEPARVSLPGEIVVTGADFYDYAAKYLDGSQAQLLCPAPMTQEQLAAGQEIAVRAFDALGCEGLARVDTFLTDHGFVVNEINTMPGFTPISMFPACWQATGVAYPDLITELLEVALDRAGVTDVRAGHPGA